MQRQDQFVLTLSCRDTKGIVHAVSGLLYQAGCNIIDSQQFGDLTGKTVAEFWDYLFHGEHIFPLLRKELAKRFPGIRFVTYEKPGLFQRLFKGK